MTIEKHEKDVGSCIVEEMNPLTGGTTLKGKDLIRPLVKTLHCAVQE